MDEKYARLLLEYCLDSKNSKYVYVHYQEEVEEFIPYLEKEAKRLSIPLVLGKENPSQIREELDKTPLEQMKTKDIFSRKEWNKVAEEGGALLFLETVSEDVFSSVENEKFEELMRIRRTSKPIYDRKLMNKELSWCIAPYPSKYWAHLLFPTEENGYEKLKNILEQVCLLKENPLLAWKQELKQAKERATYLNSLSLKTLHYQNNLGTDFTVELPLGYQFSHAGEQDAFGENIMVNMPSYEVFTSPHYLKTEGTIYSSRPLYYQGRRIHNFYLVFKKGRVVEFHAEEGEDILRGIIEGEEASHYLGEIALVNDNSPISNTGLVFNTTLLDENASCHVALGSGFSESLIGGEKMTEEERYQRGINKGTTHVDFMIGTPDLKIEGITSNGKVIPIFENSNFFFLKNEK